jgi:hypothetical protein
MSEEKIRQSGELERAEAEAAPILPLPVVAPSPLKKQALSAAMYIA